LNERIFVFNLLPCIYGYQIILTLALKFEFGHQNFGVGGQLATKLKSHFEACMREGILEGTL
jgi:hypothetical protein